MSDVGRTAVLDEANRFPSLAALHAAHTELLKRYRELGQTPELINEIEAFIRRGRATGMLLDADDDRWTAQSQLDYWVTQLYRPGYAPPDSTLTDFDPQLAPELDDALCPYRGLYAFDETDQSVFFGRTRIISEWVGKLQSERLLAVLGPSGSGKSSIVRAGLVPTLKAGALPDSANWVYLPPIVPGSDPLERLADVTRPTGISAETWARDQEIAYQSPAHLAQLIAERFKQTVIIVVDQFEELFALCDDDAIRRAFVDNLVRLTEEPDARHSVILTMRTDFESQVARLPEFQPLFEQAVVRVTPLNAAELRDAIEGPANLIGLKFEEGVVDALLNDILGEPAALPLLQFTLLKLWEQRERNRITWEAYRKVGGGRLALARSADEFYNSLIPEEQVTARRILLRLVRPGEGLEVTSRRVRRDSLYYKSDARDRIDRVLTKFVRARLLRLTPGSVPADDQVEVAHEALVRNWPMLVTWLEEERVRIRERQRLTSAADQWQALGREPSALLQGVLLDQAMRYDDLNELEAEFVQASQEAREAAVAEAEAARQRELAQAQALAEEQRQRAEAEARASRRLRQLAIALVVVSLIAVLAAVYAGSLEVQARTEANASATAAISARNLVTVQANTLGTKTVLDAQLATVNAQTQGSRLAAAQATADAAVHVAVTAQAVAQATALKAATQAVIAQETSEAVANAPTQTAAAQIAAQAATAQAVAQAAATRAAAQAAAAQTAAQIAATVAATQVVLPLTLSYDATEPACQDSSSTYYVVTYTLTADGGTPPYLYYRDIDQIGAPTSSTVITYPLHVIKGSIPGTFSVVDRTGQRANDSFFTKGITCP